MSMEKKAVLLEKEETYRKYKKAVDRTDSSICFIFGAGASYGYSSENSFFAPPIVADLFSDTNGVVKEVIRRPQHDFILGHRDFLKKALRRYNGDLERYLSELYQKNSNDDFFSSLLFYLQDIFYLASDKVQENNNSYKDLVNLLFTSRGSLPWSCITFNYDTLLEQSYIFARRDRERNFKDIKSYLNYPKILKMHGSVNFRYLLTEDNSNPTRNEKNVFGLMMDGKKDIGEAIEVFEPKTGSARNLNFLNPITIPDEKGINRAKKVYNFPLMMVPIHATKRPKHNFFLEMLKEAKNEIEKASLIIAIGYNFGDELFMSEISNIDLKNKDLILVGTKKLVVDYKSHPAYQDVIKVFESNRVHVFNGNGFTEFIDTII